MGKIYTSYFGNYRNFPGRMFTISIAQYLARYLRVDLEYKEVAPNSEILRLYKTGAISEKEYTKEYLTQLSKINFSNFLKILVNESRDKDVLLLCYEKKDAFCHRHILSGVINKIFKRVNKDLQEVTEL